MVDSHSVLDLTCYGCPHEHNEEWSQACVTKGLLRGAAIVGLHQPIWVWNFTKAKFCSKLISKLVWDALRTETKDGCSVSNPMFSVGVKVCVHRKKRWDSFKPCDLFKCPCTMHHVPALTDQMMTYLCLRNNKSCCIEMWRAFHFIQEIWMWQDSFYDGIVSEPIHEYHKCHIHTSLQAVYFFLLFNRNNVHL